MTFLRAPLVSAGLVMALGVPAAACDLHGPGQMAGFHRYNPFASTFQQLPEGSRATQGAADAESFASKKKKKSAQQDEDARRRQRALDAQETGGADSSGGRREKTEEGRAALS
ncbi:MAG: hypothetical protein AAGH57_08605 [Pseudomonadota bacterium]